MMDLDRTGEAYLGDGPVPDGDAEAVAEEVGRHCLPHDAEPQEPYLHLGFSLSPSLVLAAIPTSGLPCERPDGASDTPVQLCWSSIESSPLSSLPANPRILYNFSFFILLTFFVARCWDFFARSTRQESRITAVHGAFEGLKEWNSPCA
jgi:hypothetical protein